MLQRIFLFFQFLFPLHIILLLLNDLLTLMMHLLLLNLSHLRIKRIIMLFLYGPLGCPLSTESHNDLLLLIVIIINILNVHDSKNTPNKTLNVFGFTFGTVTLDGLENLLLGIFLLFLNISWINLMLFPKLNHK